MLILTEILILYTQLGEKYKYYLRRMSITFLYQGMNSALFKVNYTHTENIIITILLIVLTTILRDHTLFGEKNTLYPHVMLLVLVIQQKIWHEEKIDYYYNKTEFVILGFFIPFLIMIISLVLLFYTPFGKKWGLELKVIAFTSAFIGVVHFLNEYFK